MTILYFAWLRQKIGVAREQIDPPSSVVTIADLIRFLEGQSPGHADAFKQKQAIRIAIDQEFAAPESTIAGAREIAFFPPITGG